MTREEFENLINQAVEALPEGIREKLDNVEIVLEDGDSPNNSLFGLYHGVSQLHRGSTYGMGPALPDKITIWKGTIDSTWEKPGNWSCDMVPDSSTDVIIGLGKAPIFALIIASIGCFEGMEVKYSADSVGKQTTRSVVWAIFFIIVADAIFSIIFNVALFI